MSISLKDLELEVNSKILTVDFKGKKIEVKQYLPVNEKLDLISWIINHSADELKFYNVGKLDIFKILGIVKYYTNIELLEEELSVDPTKFYDLIISTDLYHQLETALLLSELAWIDRVLMDTIDSIYKYQNSIMGILDTVTTDYENLNFDVAELQKNISDPNNLTLLKDVVTKLG